jgi:hypothetical protein
MLSRTTSYHNPWFVNEGIFREEGRCGTKCKGRFIMLLLNVEVKSRRENIDIQLISIIMEISVYSISIDR